MTTLLQDLRYGLRAMARNPGFTAVAVITLALGIGGNAVMFSVVNSVLLRPLPYSDANELELVQTISIATRMPGSTSPPDFYELRRQNRTFEHLAAFYSRPRNVTGGAQPERVSALIVSPEFFTLLGTAPALGRVFSSAEEEWGSHRVVILTDALWHSRFGGDRGVIGQTMRLNDETYTVIGVIPSRFSFLGMNAQLFVPMSFEPGDNLNTHNNSFLAMVGRPKKGVTRNQAEADLNGIMGEIARRYPEVQGLGVGLTSLQEALVQGARRAILVLMGAVGFVLLIACANVANLLLARSAGRRREFAVRAALGASRLRIVRQLLTESVLLALAGGAIGLALAWWSTGAIHLVSPRTLPRVEDVQVDGTVLLFTLCASLLTGVIFGLAPAVQGRANLSGSMSEGSHGAVGARHRARSALVVAEVAFSLMLLIGAGLMLKSIQRLLDVDAGFEPSGVLTVEINIPQQKYIDQNLRRQWSRQANARANQFFEDVIARIRPLPGVRTAGAISGLPLAGENWGKVVTFYDRPLPSNIRELPAIQYRVVAGDYFRSLAIQILRGRAFSDQDTLAAPPAAIVNQQLVQQYWKGQDPIGKQLSVNPPREVVPAGTVPPGYQGPEKFTVVGVVDDVHYGALDRTPLPVVYVPFAQGSEGQTTMFLTIRSDEDPLALAGAVREQVLQVDRDQPVANISTMDFRVTRAIAQPRLTATLLGAFAGLALGLTAVGIYSVGSYVVAQRTREIGIRMALGATSGDVLRMTLGEGFRLAVIGLAAGLLGSLSLTPVLRRLLFGVSSTDPAVFATISALLAFIALMAGYVPARRAARVDPMVALRYE